MPIPGSQPSDHCTAGLQTKLIPIEGFVHEVLHRSHTSSSVNKLLSSSKHAIAISSMTLNSSFPNIPSLHANTYLTTVRSLHCWFANQPCTDQRLSPGSPSLIAHIQWCQQAMIIIEAHNCHLPYHPQLNLPQYALPTYKHIVHNTQIIAMSVCKPN
jgi:hypothetical protein